MLSPVPPPRVSLVLPYRQTRPRPRPSPAMDPDQAAFWLSQLIGKTLRIHASDGRVFVGAMKCTDKVRLAPHHDDDHQQQPPPPSH